MEVALRGRKLVFVTSVLALFSIQTVLPAMAGDDGRHGRRDYNHHDRRDWRHDRREWAHDRRDDRHHKRYTRDRDHRRGDSFNLGIYLGGPGYYPSRYYPEPYYPRYPRRSHYDGGGHALFGTVLGGGLGGLAGSRIGDGSGRTAAIIGGTLIGAMFGNSIGHAMHPHDYGQAANVFEVVPSNQTVAWRNPDDGAAYQVTPMRTYQADSGRYCREYQARAVIGGRNADTYGTACRTPDGDWQIMN